MSRPVSSSQRSLSLTEDLERLEQQITLTLQEIDHNFSKAHRIVTSSILPVIEQYAEQSRDVWEASKVSVSKVFSAGVDDVFWKQFFESSANVSLSGYEESPLDETGQETMVTEDSTDAAQSSVDETSETYDTSTSEHLDANQQDAAPNISPLSICDSHSTPRATKYVPSHEDSSIDYALTSDGLDEGVSSIETPSQINRAAPSTPGRGPARYPRNIPMTPGSTVFPPPTSLKSEKAKGRKPAVDPVLHRVLDKTYRVQATPLGGSHTTYKVHPGTTTPKLRYNLDPSPMSSPELEVPKLHSEIFSSPVAPESAKRPRKPSKPRSPKPGISVLTPAKPKTNHRSLWDSDEDFDDDNVDPTAYFGHSPPKTMQFHIPQNKLLKTPAKEASKRIVSDLLHTAGAGDTTEEFDEFENSPTVVRRAEGLEDDTF
ncbi:DASH complex subunit ask1 [Emydomyces testavorans]|uniref:DASH complex subunit ASK1 n=1 Tax=Emydomyces testavorans TaxID=2070801 RepID=A0AAF0IFD8_9EURO|nr:DASH complex subunit ask1 [Emydomyces testavorans]